uniref:Sugar phosphate transporter domain-containing protein n=1 Tax=Timspurckia oligopyrenoides TaxID=708627 RepID=A0A7S0ZLG3_9RHOD|mmetsp:Transcript_9900/g.17842  ORF Transcript_9900/g.17842 Transcript_9900/m.17842 type:complete len:451 (+) Transcript_9900:131-1483(+)|eukprot:CAMPEP_0182448082 /NCGR_PEP_ID=MMETSP1172-20130603/23322_1 /TAXON_ID=708627 /ORGANISM="Timspurckia oligopyrenoides, Strain CCMP3278" /LENGTH=450 /DNA_ID=CAMNT_0024644803 /DNA_START=47 /DNA_END=1399 /DNA_ORIENTATION=+
MEIGRNENTESSGQVSLETRIDLDMNSGSVMSSPAHPSLNNAAISTLSRTNKGNNQSEISDHNNNVSLENENPAVHRDFLSLSRFEKLKSRMSFPFQSVFSEQSNSSIINSNNYNSNNESNQQEPLESSIQKNNPKHPVWKIGLVVAFFSLSSIFSIFVNKALLTAFDFGYPSTLMLVQMFLSNVFLSILRFFNRLHVPTIDRSQYRVVLVATLYWIGNVLVGLYALRLVNIPMFSTFRRLSVLFVMAVEFYGGKRFSGRIIFAVFITVTGSVLSAVSDLTFDPLGYALVFLNNLITAFYFSSLQTSIRGLKLNSLQLYYYTSQLGVPIMIVISLFTDMKGAYYRVLKDAELQTPLFIFSVFMSATASFMVNYSTNLNVEYTTPLSTAVSSVLKNSVQTGIGLFSWGYQITMLNVVGLFVALLGSSLFTLFKMRESRDQDRMNNQNPASK